jgi:type I restriction enzyme M protein
MNQSQIESFIWGVADLIRDTFKRGKYQDVILPLTVLRRLDCVLAGKKEKVLARRAQLRGKGLENLDQQLRRAAGFAFYNTSQYDFERLCDDAPHLPANLRNYIAGFSSNMREVLEKFDFDNTISKLDEAGLLFQVVERFKNADLHPDTIDNHGMGSLFENLIRRFNEALNENPGEHFTPRDVVHLMVDLLFAGDQKRLRKPGIVRSVYDPCCGSGGMLTIAKEHVTKGVQRGDQLLRDPIAPEAEVHLFGQEVNPETFAICKSDLFMKSERGEDAERILFGSTLSNDRHAGTGFDYLIANPPYGKDWKRDKDAVEAEHERGEAGRFGPGKPRISDGQLLFLLHMLAHMQAIEAGGGRVAIIMNGSPLFTGDAGSGESEIRRHILENDWLEALIALPEQLFYNTGIATYVWVITNRKAPKRKGLVQLIDATGAEESIRFWQPMRKSLGDKRREIPLEKASEILGLLRGFEDGAVRRVTEPGEAGRSSRQGGEGRDVAVSKVFPTTHFGFRKITVERPLRLDFQAAPERIARLEDDRAFANLAVSRKRKGPVKTQEEAEGRAQQEAIRALLGRLPSTLFTERASFEKVLAKTAREAGVKLAAPVTKAILSALSERNGGAEICRDKDGNPEPDPELRDTESVPLAESIEAFFEREVKPHVPDAWIDTARRDPRDGEVGIVGYEINFNRYFYEYTPPRPLEKIEADIQAIEKDIVSMLREVAG